MYGIGLNGTLVSERASFNLNFNGQDSYSTPVLYAATPIGQVAGNIPLRSPADNYFYNGGVDYALTRDQVLRLNFQGSKFNRGNVGDRRLRSAGARLQDGRQLLRAFPAAERSDRPAVRAEYPAVDLRQRLGRRVRRSRQPRSSSTTRSPTAARSGEAARTRATTG